MQHLKYLSVTLKTLGMNYLDTIHGAHSAAYSIMVDDTMSRILHKLLHSLQQQVYGCFDAQQIQCGNTENNDNDNIDDNDDVMINVKRKYLQFVISRFACVGLAGYVW